MNSIELSCEPSFVETALKRAGAAIEEGDRRGLLKASREITERCRGYDVTKGYLAEPLMVIADHLAQDPDSFPWALAVYEKAISIAHPGGDIQQKVVERLSELASNLTDASDKIRALTVVTQFTRPEGLVTFDTNSEEARAADRIVEEISLIPYFPDHRYMKHYMLSTISSEAPCGRRNSVWGLRDVNYLRMKASVKLEELDEELADTSSDRRAAKQFVEKYSGEKAVLG